MSQNNTSTNPDQALNLMSVESMINSFNAKLKELQTHSKEYKDMLKSILDSNDEYLEANHQAGKAAKVKSQAKRAALSSTNAQELEEKIQDHQTQIKEAKQALSDYLSQYVSLSGTNQLETPDGTMLEIIYTAKLVRKKD